jgi:hypothetical protein
MRQLLMLLLRAASRMRNEVSLPRVIAGICGFLGLALLSLAAAEPSEPTPTIRVPRVSRPPKIDDFLTGTPREAEVVVTDFWQMQPGDGTPVSQPTTAYLSYDEKNLYVVFVCKDNPSLIRARKAKRKDIMTDDRVTINIDTFNDHLRAYFFDANPYGIQLDGTTTQGQGDDLSFETLWYTEGRLTKDGYIVLEQIPFKSLRFPKKEKQTWGIVLGRYINRNNEWSLWPYVTLRKFPVWVGQFGHMEGLEGITPGRNLQFIPYGLFGKARFLETPAWAEPRWRSQYDGRVGLDTKLVLRGEFAVDVTINPDFSQVESDEPQVTVNQRYEVYFPEKRPFFLESAGYFNTPQNLLFSRRIVDPEFGVRVTGHSGQWAVGALAVDDRAPGEQVAPDDPLAGKRAVNGVFRLQRQFGREAYVGVLAATRHLSSYSNQVVSLDARLPFRNNWVVSAQAVSSATQNSDRTHQAGPAYYAALTRSGRHLEYYSVYSDRSPGFRADLGYIPRVDVRQLAHSFDYRWRPESSRVVSYGPGFLVSHNWNRAGRVQDWEARATFNLELPKLSEFHVSRSQSFELFRDIGFRKSLSRVWLSSEWWKRLALTADFSQGAGVNYYPGPGLVPFKADVTNGSLGVTLRPRPHIRIEETYLYSHLAAGEAQPGVSPGSSVFNNHILRSKVNYQFTRELSLRGILDYNAVLPNPALVSLERKKRVGYDILLTYMLHPGTALYIGATDVYENLYFDPMISPALRRTMSPSLSTARQVFVKFSYLFRF